MDRKKARSKKSVPKKRTSTGGKKSPALLRTSFMADFTKTFIHDGSTDLWPVDGQKRADIIADFQVFVTVLSAVGYGLPAPVNNGALGARIVQFVGAPRNWPNNPARVAPRLQGRLSTVALVDIAVIVDRLLKAMNGFQVVDGGAGGKPGGWPPH